MPPKVSLVIPTFKRNEALRRAIESGRCQTYLEEKIEVFVIDGAEGNARSVAEEFGVNYFSPTPDPGLAECRQIGIDEADSEYIHFLDDDDTLTDQAIESQVHVAEATGAGVVYGGVQWPNGQVIHPNPAVRGDILSQALAFEMAPCIPSTMLISSKVLNDVPQLGALPSDDIALNIELGQETEYEFVDEVIIKRQGGEAGIGGDEETVENRRKTIAEYRHLYQNYPDAYRRAKAATNLLAAQAEFRDHIWSPRAIWNGFQAAWNSPSFITVGYAVSSVLGRPGRDLARYIYTEFLLDEANEGKIW